MATFTIKQHDTAPAVTSTLTDGLGAAVNLTGSAVRFHMVDRAGVVIVNAVATIVDGPTGKVSYSWQAADTSRDGVFRGEWEVTFSGGGIETFPNNENLTINIPADLA